MQWEEGKVDMNRRNFLGTLLSATAGFSILPGAGRLWKAQRPVLVTGFWFQTTREVLAVSEGYKEVALAWAAKFPRPDVIPTPQWKDLEVFNCKMVDIPGFKAKSKIHTFEGWELI